MIYVCCYRDWRNHSLRVTSATTLFDAGVPEAIVQKRTEHKSLGALCCYEWVILDQERSVADILTPKKSFLDKQDRICCIHLLFTYAVYTNTEWQHFCGFFKYCSVMNFIHVSCLVTYVVVMYKLDGMSEIHNYTCSPISRHDDTMYWVYLFGWYW